MINFYRECIAVIEKRKVIFWSGLGALFVFLLQAGLALLALLPCECVTLLSICAWLVKNGLFFMGLINMTIGIFYFANSKGKEASANDWLKKKGRLFVLIGLAVGAIGIVIGGKEYAFDVLRWFYLGYGFFCWLAMKNYIHFQSLPWQRLMLCMNETAGTIN